jgi:FkbM family methyltransferase
MLVERYIYGSRMLLDMEDTGLSADLWKDGKREWNCPEITKSILRKGWTCLDIGCNLGMYALLECKTIGPSGFVHAIEPVKKSCDIFLKSLLLNGYTNCAIHTQAIGNKDRMNQFLIRPQSNLCRMRYTQARPVGGDIVEVPEQTLDSFVEEHGIGRIDFLRYDIESYEIELVEGAQKTLAGMKPGAWMFGEWHTIHFEDPTGTFQDALQNVVDHGFEPRHVIHLLDEKGRDHPGMEKRIAPKDFARILCHDFPKSAPRIFFEKC